MRHLITLLSLSLTVKVMRFLGLPLEDQDSVDRVKALHLLLR
ncbi:UNVERIFIED_CONTAM: hypothetical protein GTU68_058991 [Idotea baltica]|nr:hypothetical protein [Idotea baltica]